MIISPSYIYTCTVSFILLLGIIFYTRIKGPNSWMAQLSFWIPIVATVILLVLVFYTDSFWWGLLVNVVTLFAIQIIGVIALENTLEDKTGLGVSMFSGFLALYGIAGVLFVKLILFWLS